MPGSRARLLAFVEWIVAAALLAMILVLGSRALGAFRTVSTVLPVSASEASAPVPTASIPPRAVSVPVLLLLGGKEVRVGDSASAVTARMDTESAIIVTESIERAPTGERLTRFYDVLGTHFILVLEPFEQGEEPRVAAIYRQ